MHCVDDRLIELQSSLILDFVGKQNECVAPDLGGVLKANCVHDAAQFVRIQIGGFDRVKSSYGECFAVVDND